MDIPPPNQDKKQQFVPLLKNPALHHQPLNDWCVDSIYVVKWILLFRYGYCGGHKCTGIIRTISGKKSMKYNLDLLNQQQRVIMLLSSHTYASIHIHVDLNSPIIPAHTAVAFYKKSCAIMIDTMNFFMTTVPPFSWRLKQELKLEISYNI